MENQAQSRRVGTKVDFPQPPVQALRLIAGLIVFLSLLALAPPAAAQPPAPPDIPGWIVDPESGCAAWNAYPEPHETIRWSGSCVGGLAEGWGVLQWYLDGTPQDRFEGRLHQGRHEGYGLYVFANGDSYEGGWRAGKFEGHGLYIDARGSRYEGEFRDGKAEGPGTRWDADGTVFTGTWVNGCLRRDESLAAVGWAAWKCGFR